MSVSSCLHGLRQVGELLQQRKAKNQQSSELTLKTLPPISSQVYPIKTVRTSGETGAAIGHGRDNHPDCLDLTTHLVALPLSLPATTVVLHRQLLQWSCL